LAFRILFHPFFYFNLMLAIFSKKGFIPTRFFPWWGKSIYNNNKLDIT